MKKTNKSISRFPAAGFLLAALPVLFFTACPQMTAPENSRKKETVTITLDANGGLFEDGSVSSSIVKTIGTGLTLKELPEAGRGGGYSFAGWYTGPEGTAKYDFSRVAGTDLTLYARWNWSFAVTFDANGGTVSGAASTIRTVNSPATTVAALPTPSKSNDVFLGWFTDRDLWETPFTLETVVGGDLRVYAKWNGGPISYTVTFNANGGAFADTTMEKTATVTIPGNGLVPSGEWPADPTRAAKEFDGWYTLAEGGELVVSNTVITESQTLYAHWVDFVQPTTVVFNANGGGWSDGDKEKTVSGKINQALGSGKMPGNPSRGGYQFQSWNTVADGSGTAFNASTVVSVENMTVYASYALRSNLSTTLTSVSYEVEGDEFVGTVTVSGSGGGKVWSTFNDGTTVQTVNGLKVLNFRDGQTDTAKPNGGYSEVILDPIAGAFISATSWTIEMYFKMDRLNVKLDPLQIYTGTAINQTNGTLRIEHGTSGNWQLQTYSGGRKGLDMGQRPTQHQWFHVAIVRNGAELNVYFNGELKQTNTTYGDYYTAGAFPSASISNVHAGRAQNAGLYRYVFTRTAKTAADFAGVAATLNTLNATP
ncbi:MAG: InlB B-repeat-containing protein [Treponema sp.]|jgi:uncharacterized repeat protein (TIGR02543 family)|nr:InlB B-repeat-containing protein [Treponema sp.]